MLAVIRLNLLLTTKSLIVGHLLGTFSDFLVILWHGIKCIHPVTYHSRFHGFHNSKSIKISFVLGVCELLTRKENLSTFSCECFLSQNFLKQFWLDFVLEIVSLQIIWWICIVDPWCFARLLHYTALKLNVTIFIQKKKTFLRTSYSHIDLTHTRGANCHFELKRVSYNKSFNWWSLVICKQAPTPSSRIAKKSGRYPISQSFCNM
jgi:hypothetical protein